MLCCWGPKSKDTGWLVGWGFMALSAKKGHINSGHRSSMLMAAFDWQGMTSY